MRSDADGAEKILRGLVGDPGAALAARWQGGEIRQVAYFPPTWEDAGPGASLVHPLLVHRYRRDIADAEELIQALGTSAGEMSAGYVRRAWRLLYLGDFAKAEADINRLLAMNGPHARHARSPLGLVARSGPRR